MSIDKYEVVMGLEVHVQAKTKSKMFCDCDSNYFNATPNSHTCPVCFGLPGALPVPNRKAIDLCVKTSLALNCSINMETKFDRKNYFYPDLPKGFQISQYDQPIGYLGYIDVETSQGLRKIGITRVHQEEDTGKSIHANNETMLDFNKSGVPLIEIVTEPDFRTKEEVTAFAKRLKQIVRYSDISNADMEKGQMRFELNISLRKVGETELPKYKVEVKNIGSISVLEKVIESEIVRQTEILESGETPRQETRGLLNMSGETASQRSKESEADYRYFPEPDIPLITFTEDEIAKIKATLPELPATKKQRYMGELGIDSASAEVITAEVENFEPFEDMIRDAKKELIPDIAKWYVGEIFGLQKKSKPHESFVLKDIIILVEMVKNGEMTRAIAKQILVDAYTKGVDIKKESQTRFRSLDNVPVLDVMIDDIIKRNQKVVDDIKKNPNAIMFLVGQAMKETGGSGDVNKIKAILESKLK